MEHRYIIIMAGGSGTRLWPLSRKRDPKQFHAFLSEKTLLQETYARAIAVLPAAQIFVSTTENYAELVCAQLPDIPKERLILEPEARNTAPAIALVAATMAAYDPEAVVATIASDHAIENSEEFVASVAAALSAIERHPEKLATIGINPTKPDTGLGYIKIGQEFSDDGERRVFFVDDFKEKPDTETAIRYVESWEYLWNAGYFIFKASVFQAWTEKLAPLLQESTTELIAGRQTLDAAGRLAAYRKAPSEAVEPLIIEKLSAEERLVIPTSLRWSDVGNWSTLFQFLHEKKGTSIISEGNHTDLGSQDILVKAGRKPIFTLGLKNIVIIETDDALLVADKDAAGSEMKALIEKLKTEGKEDLL